VLAIEASTYRNTQASPEGGDLSEDLRIKAVDLHQSSMQNKAYPFAACRRGHVAGETCQPERPECPYA
jgi:hypothetical protein